MLDRISQPFPMAFELTSPPSTYINDINNNKKNMTTRPLATKPKTASYERLRDVDALVKRCEASLARLSTLSAQSNIYTLPITLNPVFPMTDVHAINTSKKSGVSITVSEIRSKRTASIPKDRKWKIEKRPTLSRAGSGLASKSISSGSSANVVHITSTPSQYMSPVPLCDVVVDDISQAGSPVQNAHTVIPNDTNICALLYTGISTSNPHLTNTCITYLHNRSAFHPLITIKALTPFFASHPTLTRPILLSAVRTLLDDFPEYDAHPSYLTSVSTSLQPLFSHEWCRYVRRIKSFHENTPFDDFDYTHDSSCQCTESCEQVTRETVRDRWNSFWKDSIVRGNRCVPKPSEVAAFFCTYEAGGQCAGGVKEELIQTLECIGGVNAKWTWMFLGDGLFKNI